MTVALAGLYVLLEFMVTFSKHFEEFEESAIKFVF